MPILKVYSGKTSVEANSKYEAGKPFYLNSKTAYGQTLGELFDNLVSASIALATETYKWIAQNKPPEYTMEDDYWYSFTSHPDILESHIKRKPNEKDEDYDTGSGGSIKTIKEIVSSCILHRDLSISSALGSLSRKNNEPTMLPKNPALPYSAIYDSMSFQEMADCGYNGIELDSILDISKSEDRLDDYLSSLANLRAVHARRSIAQERQSKKAKKAEKPQKYKRPLSYSAHENLN